MSDVDLSHLKELSDAANALLNDRAFTQAVLSLRKRWFDELLAAEDLEVPKVLGLRNKIQALEAIPVELNILMNDHKMAAKRNG